MTNVIELAKQAGFQKFLKPENRPEMICDPAALERFAALVRNAALEQAKQIDWTEVMREGQLVTWGDASTLGYRVFEKLESLKEPTP